MNIWQHVRLAGSVVMIVGSVIGRLDLSLIGFAVVLVGTVNGLYAIERRVDSLEKGEKNEKTEA